MRLGILDRPEEPSAALQEFGRANGLPFFSNPKDVEVHSDFHLFVHEGRIALKSSDSKGPGAIYVDFETGAAAHRRRFGGGKGQDIARACGLSSKHPVHIVDLTAGLGGDGFVLASLGAQVELIERHPVVHLLLQDGIERAARSSDPELRSIFDSITLVFKDGLDWCSQQEQQVDVIYLDPMFPKGAMRSAVKKEMATFRTLVGSDPDGDELLESALKVARHRVVVKRPRKASDLGERRPNFRIEGKSGRFDVYTNKALPK